MDNNQIDLVARIEQGEDLHVFDLAIVLKNYLEITQAFPNALIHAAVKANSATGVLETLNAAGCNFEIATIEELQMCIRRGIDPHKIIFSHPDKEPHEIKMAYRLGVKTFVTDSYNDLIQIAEYAPCSSIFIRILSEYKHKDSQMSFNSRFGLHVHKAEYLVNFAVELGLNPRGVAFHVGTQTEDPNAWNDSIISALELIRRLKTQGINLTVLDIGGGFPARHNADVPSMQQIADNISQTLKQHVGDLNLQLMLEPGRKLSATAAYTLGRVVNVKYNPVNQQEHVITVSTGKFSAGLLGTASDLLFYRKGIDQKLQQLSGVQVAARLYGKACASLDEPFGQIKMIPQGLKTGDIVLTTNTGAYCNDMSSTWCQKAKPSEVINVRQSMFLAKL